MDNYFILFILTYCLFALVCVLLGAGGGLDGPVAEELSDRFLNACQFWFIEHPVLMLLLALFALFMFIVEYNRKE